MASHTMTRNHKQDQAKQRQVEEATDHKEGEVAKAIENETAKLPSDTFLWASLGAMGASLVLKACKKDHLALFVGQWASPFLLLGIYNKLVKLEGHDKKDKLSIG